MADPFEVRMRFTSQLQHLNASSTSAFKAANYAIRNAEFGDDLHSCILEQLERNNLNNRANIMYFLPALCDAAKAAGELAYVRMIERDILLIVDLVAPDDTAGIGGATGARGAQGVASANVAGGSTNVAAGAANVKVVRKVLQLLHQKSFLKDETVQELEECIAGRERLDDEDDDVQEAGADLDIANSNRLDDDMDTTQDKASSIKPSVSAPATALEKGHSRPSATHTKAHAPPQSTNATSTQHPQSSAARSATPHSTNNPTDAAAVPHASHSRPSRSHHHHHHNHTNIRIDKRQLEQRIEEDRERHKRAREGIWAIAQQQGVANLASDTEFDTQWTAAPRLGLQTDDLQLAKEEAAERRRYLEYEEIMAA